MAGVTMPFTAPPGCCSNRWSTLCCRHLCSATPGQQCSHADFRRRVWEEGRNVYVNINGSSPLTAVNLQHFVQGDAVMRAAENKQTSYAVLLERKRPPMKKREEEEALHLPSH